MQVEIWSEEKLRFLGFCLKRGPLYNGPYPTTALQFQPNVLLLSANSWLYLIDMPNSKILGSRNLKQQVLKIAAGRRMVVAAMESQIQLLNEQLQTVRSFELQHAHQVLALWHTPKGFLVHYSGEPAINSQPLVRFVRVDAQAGCCQYQNLRIRYERGVLCLTDTQKSVEESVILSEVPNLPDKAIVLECREVGAVLAVSIDKKVAICISLEDHTFLYSLPCVKLGKQMGPYIAEVKGKLLHLTFLDESGPICLGTLPLQEDQIEAVLPIGSSFYLVKQILQDGLELRMVEKCQLAPAKMERSQSERVLLSASSMVTPPDTPRADTVPVLTISEPAEVDPVPQLHHSEEAEAEVLPKFPGPGVQHKGFSMHEDLIPCSPIVEVVENHKNLFTTAKTLFLTDNIDEELERESNESCESSAKELENSGETSKFAFAQDYKLSFGSLETYQKPPQLVAPPSNVEEFIAKNGEVPIRELLQFIDLLPADRRPSDQLMKRLSLLDHVGKEDYRLLSNNQSVMVLLEELYARHGKKLEAIEAFAEEVIKFSPTLITELLESLPQTARLQKMRELLKRLPSEVLRKKFKRECYQFLSDLPLKSIPGELLLDPLGPQELKLLLLFRPLVLLVELSNPAELLSVILNHYFSEEEEELESDCVEIEGEVIEVTNPRNMLNIVLYFAEVFNIPAEEAIRRYLVTLLSKNLVDLVDHIIYTEGVLDLCGLPVTLIEDIVRNHERELYYGSGQNMEDFHQCLDLVRQNLEFKRKANCRLNIIHTLARENVLIMYSDVYLLDQLRNGFQFIERIIQQEAPEVVVGLGLESLYESVWILEDTDNENSKLSFYTRELLELVEQLIVRCFECKRYEEGLDCMMRIQPRLKLGLLVHCLLRYLRNEHRSSYEEELASDYLPILKRYSRDSLHKLVNSLCKSEPDNPQEFELAADEYSESECGFVCSYSMMRDKLRRCGNVVKEDALLDLESFCSLLYTRSKMAIVMARYDKGIGAAELKAYLTMMQKLGYFNRIEDKKHKPKEICPELPICLAIPILERWSPEPPLPREELQDVPEELERITHTDRHHEDHVKRANSVEHLMIKLNREECKSMVTEDPRNRKKKNPLQLRRRESSPESLDVSEVKQLVGRHAELKAYFEHFYEKNSSHRMERLIEKAKVNFNLYWTEQLRNIEDYEVNYDYRRIFSFEFLCEKDEKAAFEIIRPSIEEELCEKTFWVVAYMVGYVLGDEYGRTVAVMYIERLLKAWKDDCLEEEKEQIQAVIEFYGLHGDNLARLLELGESLQLKEAHSLLAAHPSQRRESARRALFA